MSQQSQTSVAVKEATKNGSPCYWRRANGQCGLKVYATSVAERPSLAAHPVQEVQDGYRIAREIIDEPGSISGILPDGTCGVEYFQNCSRGSRRI